MAIHYLQSITDFPNPNLADDEGLLAIGGELSPDWLLKAYSIGVFPWFNEDDPILWWCPNPRMVLFPNEFKVSKSFRNILNRNQFEVTINKDFTSIIEGCANRKRKEQEGTWLSKTMVKAYVALHSMGWAHSVEVWQNGKIVGGLYGVAFNKIFFGESMFSLVSNASKIALHYLCLKMMELKVDLIDCQVYTQHLKTLGAKNMERTDFLNYLQANEQMEKVLFVKEI